MNRPCASPRQISVLSLLAIIIAALLLVALTGCSSTRVNGTADTKRKYDPVHGWNFGPDNRFQPNPKEQREMEARTQRDE